MRMEEGKRKRGRSKSRFMDVEDAEDTKRWRKLLHSNDYYYYHCPLWRLLSGEAERRRGADKRRSVYNVRR